MTLRQFLCKMLGHDYSITVIEDYRPTHDVCTRCGMTANHELYKLIEEMTHDPAPIRNC